MFELGQFQVISCFLNRAIIFSFSIFYLATTYAANKNTMEYVKFCNPTGECRNFSRLVMGTDHLSQSAWVNDNQLEPKKEDVFAVLDEAARFGINLFDTSPIYVGGVENTLGEWRETRRSLILKDSFYVNRKLNPDRDIYALSKGGFPFDLFWLKELPAGCHSIELINELKKQGIVSPYATDWVSQSLPLQNVPPGSYASHLYCNKEIMIDRISHELKYTRKNLNCDIDVYLMHRDDGDAIGFTKVKREQTPVENILDAISAPEVSNQIFMLGWSNWETHRVNKSLELANQSDNYIRPMINSPYFSLFEMSERTIHALGVQVTHVEMSDPNFQKGIKIMPYSPLGGFSILDKPVDQWQNAKKAAHKKYLANDAYWKNVYHSIFTEENEKRWNRAIQFTKDFNKVHKTNYTIDQVLNAYVLAHPRTDMLAIGPITVEQLRRTIGALKLSKMFTSQDLEHLYSGQVAPSFSSVKSLCLSAPKNVDKSYIE